MKILFVAGGDADGAETAAVRRLAQELQRRGRPTALALDGAGPEDMGAVAGLTHDDVRRAPAAALAFDGHPPEPDDTVVVAWSARESVRATVRDLRRCCAGVRLVTHLEADERVLTAGRLGRPWSDLACLPPHVLDPLVGPELAHPHRLSAFLAGVDGLTAGAPALLAHAAGAPTHLLRPGCDPDGVGPPLSSGRRRALLAALGVPCDHRVIVCPDETHPLHPRAVFSLCVAVQILRRRGLPVTLLLPGEPDSATPWGPGARSVAREVGRLNRREFLVLLRMADVLVQPGAPDAFHRARLPAALPDMFCSGRPVLLPRANLGEEVRDEEEACVLERGDGVEIADRAERLLRDPAHAAAIGEAGRRFAARTLCWRRSAEGLERFLHTLPSRPRRARELAA